MFLLKNFIEKKKFKNWLEEKTHKKSKSLDDYIKDYGEEKGKSVFYRIFKKKTKGRKVNESLTGALIGGGLAVGTGLYMLNKYKNINKTVNQANAAYQRKYGKPPGKQAASNIMSSSIRSVNQKEIEPFDRMFRPEISSQSRGPGGRMGPQIITQTRGTVRQAIKDKVSNMLSGHPILQKGFLDLGSKVANRISNKIENIKQNKP